MATHSESVLVIQPSSGTGPPAKAEYPINNENIVNTKIKDLRKLNRLGLRLLWLKGLDGLREMVLSF